MVPQTLLLLMVAAIQAVVVPIALRVPFTVISAFMVENTDRLPLLLLKVTVLSVLTLSCLSAVVMFRLPLLPVGTTL